MSLKLGNALLRLRKNSNLSQNDISKIINCSRNTYACWEHDDGEIPLSKLLQLLNYCNVSLATFLKSLEEENEAAGIQLPDIEQNEINIKAELTSIISRMSQLNQILT